MEVDAEKACTETELASANNTENVHVATGAISLEKDNVQAATGLQSLEKELAPTNNTEDVHATTLQNDMVDTENVQATGVQSLGGSNSAAVAAAPSPAPAIGCNNNNTLSPPIQQGSDGGLQFGFGGGAPLPAVGFDFTSAVQSLEKMPSKFSLHEKDNVDTENVQAAIGSASGFGSAPSTTGGLFNLPNNNNGAVNSSAPAPASGTGVGFNFTNGSASANGSGPWTSGFTSATNGSSADAKPVPAPAASNGNKASIQSFTAGKSSAHEKDNVDTGVKSFSAGKSSAHEKDNVDAVQSVTAGESSAHEKDNVDTANTRVQSPLPLAVMTPKDAQAATKSVHLPLPLAVTTPKDAQAATKSVHLPLPLAVTTPKDAKAATKSTADAKRQQVVLTFGAHQGGVRGFPDDDEETPDKVVPPSVLISSNVAMELEKTAVSSTGTLVLRANSLFSCGETATGRVPDLDFEGDKVSDLTHALDSLEQRINRKIGAICKHLDPGDLGNRDEGFLLGTALMLNIKATESVSDAKIAQLSNMLANVENHDLAALLQEAVAAVANRPELKNTLGYYLKDIAPEDDERSLLVKVQSLEELLSAVSTKNPKVPDKLDFVFRKVQELHNLLDEYKPVQQQFDSLKEQAERQESLLKPISFHDNRGVDETSSIKDVSAGQSYGLALSHHGNVYFFGHLKDPLGESIFSYKEDGSIVEQETSNTPVLIFGAPAGTKESAVAIFAGPNYFYIQGQSSELYSAGFGGAGQLGRQGSTIEIHSQSNLPHAHYYSDSAKKYDMKAVYDILLPKPICSLLAKSPKGRTYRLKKGDKCLKLAAGTDHCLSLWELSGQRRVFAIGSNQENRAGLDDSIDRVQQFTEIGFFSDKPVFDIACGATHSCVVLDKDKSLYTFGSNSYGQLGFDPDVVRHTIPVRVDFPKTADGTLRHIAIVAAGVQSTLVGTPGGSTFSMGELGTGRQQDGPTKKPEFLDLALDGYRIVRVIDVNVSCDHGALCLDLEKLGFCLELEKQDDEVDHDDTGGPKQKGGASETSNLGESGKVDH